MPRELLGSVSVFAARPRLRFLILASSHRMLIYAQTCSHSRSRNRVSDADQTRRDVGPGVPPHHEHGDLAARLSPSVSAPALAHAWDLARPRPLGGHRPAPAGDGAGFHH